MTEDEVTQTVERGVLLEVNGDRAIRRRVFTRGYSWLGQDYPHKEVTVVYTLEASFIIVITALARYGPLGGNAMRITYDPEADAAYFYISGKIDLPDTRQLDRDIIMDFDAADRLVGVEVLDASRRLDIGDLLPSLEIIGREEPGWIKLKVKLLHYKQAGTPIDSPSQGKKNWIEDVGKNHISIRLEETGKVVKITRDDLDNKDEAWHKNHRRKSLVKALWEIGSYS